MVENPRQWLIDEFTAMYERLHDPKKRQEAKREFERRKRIEEKKKDTGA